MKVIYFLSVEAMEFNFHNMTLFSVAGGFLAQKFAEVNAHCPRIVSLILCNTFTDTSVFSYNDSAAMCVSFAIDYRLLNKSTEIF